MVAALEAGLADALGTPVSIGAVRGPLVPRFELVDVRVGPEDRPVATAPRVAVRVAPDADGLVFATRVVIEELEIEGLAVTLRRDAAGWELPGAFESTDEPAEDALPLTIVVRRTRFVDARVDVVATGGDVDAALAARFEADARDVVFPPGDEPVRFGAASLSLALEEGDLGGTRVERGTLEAGLDAEHALDFAASAGGGFGDLDFRGRGDLDAWLAGRTDPDTRVEIVFAALDVSALAGEGTPATRIDGRAELAVGERTGRDGAPEVVVTAALDRSQVGPISLSRAKLVGALLDDAWQVDELSLAGDGLDVAGEAAGVGLAPDRVALTARVERLDRLSGWLATDEGRAVEQALAGSLSLEVELTGGVERATGRVAADARGLVWQGTKIGDVTLRAKLRDGERAVLDALTVENERLPVRVAPGAVLRRAGANFADGVAVEALRARSGDATLAADGVVTSEGVRDLHLVLADLRPARLAAFGLLDALAGVAEPTAGRLDADVVLDGPFGAPRVEGSLALRGGAASVPALGETFAPIDARVRLEDEVLRIDALTIGPPGARAEISGRIEMPGLRPGRADLRLHVDDFPLTRVPLPGALAANGARDEAGAEASTAAATGISTGGRVDADLTLTGPLSAPVVAGDLDWRDPRWEDVQLERITMHVETDESLARGTIRMRYAGHEILVADARLPLLFDASEPIDFLRDDRARLEIRGESLDFALLQPFLTRLVRNPRGTADVKLVVSGGRPEPSVDGVLLVSGGSLRVPLLRQTFAPVSGIARFDGREIDLESLTIGTPDAGLEAEGTLVLAGLRPERVDLSVRLANFPASRSTLVKANVDGHVDLTGAVEAPSLSGELTLRDGRVTLRAADPVAREVVVRASARDDSLREERAERGPSLLDRASVDLSVKVPGDTWIRTPELELDVEGWARLVKPPREPPSISGTLTTRRGTVRVVGKRFRLRRGEATLDGSAEPDPVLDIEAVHPVADIVVVAYVTGRASAPTLRLESEPDLPEDDVTSYLFFGRPSSQLAAGEQGDVSMAAAGLAAGVALDELRDVFGDDLPIDTIDVRIEEGDEPSRVEVGKYVAKDVFVRYGHTFGAEPVEQIGISYRLNEHWRVESTTASDATAGADLFWIIDY